MFYLLVWGLDRNNTDLNDPIKSTVTLCRAGEDTKGDAPNKVYSKGHTIRVTLGGDTEEQGHNTVPEVNKDSPNKVYPNHVADPAIGKTDTAKEVNGDATDKVNEPDKTTKINGNIEEKLIKTYKIDEDDWLEKDVIIQAEAKEIYVDQEEDKQDLSKESDVSEGKHERDKSTYYSPTETHDNKVSEGNTPTKSAVTQTSVTPTHPNQVTHDHERA